MAFDTFVNAENNANAGFGVKVSYGNEIRRAACADTTYASLCEVVAKLFELGDAKLTLKYQDEDGDKITMSSDAELQEAIRLAKAAKKIIRLFVETNAKVKEEEMKPADPEVVEVEAPADHWRGGPHARRGMWGRGGFHHGPQHHVRFPPHHGPGPFPHAPFGGRGFHHGPYAFRAWGGDEARRAMRERKIAMKEHRQQMKQQLEEMKAACQTKEDKEAIKAFKVAMKEEWKDAWKDMKKMHKEEEKDEKKERKEEKKDKKEKKDKRDKHHHDKHHEKHHKCERGARDERLMARHVADVTIPDNSTLPADTPVIKTWRLKNVGTAAWPAESQLVFVSRHGDNLNGPERVPVAGPVEPGQELEVSVPFITPAEPGRYVGYYRLATADGVKFGQRVWVSFLIPAAPANTTTPTAPSAMDQ